MTYQRTTQAVGDAVDAAFFEDPDWVVRWDVASQTCSSWPMTLTRPSLPRPWRLAFQADPKRPTIVHLLLGMNAHINYDLPQATLSVITDHDFEDPALIDRRRRDHERIDRILAIRVAAEDHARRSRSAGRILTPANRLSTAAFAKLEQGVAECRRAAASPTCRRRGLSHSASAELEVLSAAKIADLMRPGQVLVRLALTGFGVTLPPPCSAISQRGQPRSDPA